MKAKEIKKSISIKQYLSDKGIEINYSKPFRCPHPNHEDIHPSCAVFQNPDGDYIRCFSCDLRGDIFNLVGVLEGLNSFKEQANFLEERYGK